MCLKVALQRFEVRVRAFAPYETQLHEPTRCVVDEDQQCAWLTTLLEPAVVAAIDLNQFAVALASQSRLMKASTLLARQPEAIGDHPSPQRLSTHLKRVLVEQNLNR
jgi:hypothetical protein